MNSKKKTPVISIVLYVIAALLAILFAYMLGASILYIKDYLAQYSMSFSDVASDSIKMIINQSVAYLVYAILVFAAGKVIALTAPLAAAVGVVEEISEEETADLEVSESFDTVDQAVEAVREADEAVKEADEAVETIE